MQIQAVGNTKLNGIMLNGGICTPEIFIGSNYEHGLRRRNSTLLNYKPFCLGLHPSPSMDKVETSKTAPILLTTIKEKDKENVVCSHGKDLRVA